MNKKKIGFIVVAIVLLLTFGRFCLPVVLSYVVEEKSEDVHAKTINYLNNNVDLALLVYGKDINFRKDVKYEKINELSKKTYGKENDYVYLLINDLDGDVKIDKDQIRELKDYAESNTNFNFFYLGTTKLQTFSEAGFEDVLAMEDDMSYGYVVQEGVRLPYLGVWSENDHRFMKKNPQLLAENVLETITKLIVSNE